MKPAIAILGAYVAKRWTLAKLRTQRDVKARQQRLLAQLLDHAGSNIPFYRPHAGVHFTYWPVIDKAIARAHFSDLNAHGLSSEQARQMAESALANGDRSGWPSGLTISAGSGDSSTRGLFLHGESERYGWLGSILARALPDFPFTRHRIAVMMPADNALHRMAEQFGRLGLRFFDLRHDLAAHRETVEAFAPDVLVAPPKALRAVAEQGFRIKPFRIFAGGEVLDTLDAVPVTGRYGVEPCSIYQPAEGFIGITCRCGMIHLNEDDLLIEREPIEGHPDRFFPIVTDLRRRSQAMIRYRLDDILVSSPYTCACGSPLQTIERIEGRREDVIELSKDVSFMPGDIRLAILNAAPLLEDFRFEQIGDRRFRLRLPHDAPERSEDLITASLRHLFGEHGAGSVSFQTARGIHEPVGSRLRRIRRINPSGQSTAA